MSNNPQDPSSQNDEYPYGEDPYGEKAIPYQRESTPPPNETENPYGATPYPYGEQPAVNDPRNAPESYAPQQAMYGYGIENQQQDYNNTPPEAVPLPLGEATRQLVRQYLRTIFKPSVRNFAQEKGKASWDIVWVQLLGLGIIFAITNYLAGLINPTSIPTSMSDQYLMTPDVYQALKVGTSISFILIIPLSFFIGVGILHLIAKMLGGRGSFLQYSYSILLFAVPLHTLTSLLQLIPVAGPGIYMLTFLLSLIYEAVLGIFATMAVHKVSGGRGSAVILIPFFIALLLFACAAATLISLLIAAQ